MVRELCTKGWLMIGYTKLFPADRLRTIACGDHQTGRLYAFARLHRVPKLNQLVSSAATFYPSPSFAHESG